MSVVIRSAKVMSEPLVLERARGATLEMSVPPPIAEPEPLSQYAPESSGSAETSFAQMESYESQPDPAVTHAEAPVDIGEPEPEPQTYEDFQRQLGDELERMKQAAHERGYAEGERVAQEKVRAEYAAEIEALKAIVSSLRETLDQQIDGVGDIAAEVAFEAVTRMLGDGYVDRSGAAAVVREVVRHAKDRSRLVIRVHPDDHEAVSACAEDVVRGLSSGGVDVVADDRVSLGGCLLETPAGNLDGRLEIQMQQFRDALVSARLRRDGVEGEA